MILLFSPFIFSVIIFIIGFILLLGVIQSTWMRDLRARYSRKFRKNSTRTIIEPRQSNSTTILENRAVSHPENQASEIYPNDYDYKISSFSPSSFTTILRNTKQFSNIKTQKAGLDPYYAEPTFVKNQRSKGKTQEISEKTKQRPVHPKKVKQAADFYWTDFLAASQKNINKEATVPTVLPAHPKISKKPLFDGMSTDNSTNPSRTTSTASTTKTFTMPSKPNVINSSTSSESSSGTTGASGGGLKLGGTGGGLKLGGGTGGGLKLGGGTGGGLKLGTGLKLNLGK